jgi:hypothetical protein
VRNGPISIIAKCETVEVSPGMFRDQIRLIVVTTVFGAVAVLSDRNFPDTANNFLDPTTPEDDREMAVNTSAAGDPDYENGVDRGSVIAPTGHVILIDGEILGLGLNIFDTDCLVAGVFHIFRGFDDDD